MPCFVQVCDDRVEAPIAIPVDDIAPIAVRQEIGIESRILRPRGRKRADPQLSGRRRDLVFA